MYCITPGIEDLVTRLHITYDSWHDPPSGRLEQNGLFKPHKRRVLDRECLMMYIDKYVHIMYTSTPMYSIVPTKMFLEDDFLDL